MYKPFSGRTTTSLHHPVQKARASLFPRDISFVKKLYPLITASVPLMGVREMAHYQKDIRDGTSGSRYATALHSSEDFCCITCTIS